MLNFQEVCSAPAFCEQCQDMVVANYLPSSPKCPGCGRPVVFYDDPSLQAEMPSSGEEDNRWDAFSWHASDDKYFRLPNTKYSCPQCGEKRMTFADVGCWD